MNKRFFLSYLLRTRDNLEILVFLLCPTGNRNRDLIEGVSMKIDEHAMEVVKHNISISSQLHPSTARYSCTEPASQAASAPFCRKDQQRLNST